MTEEPELPPHLRVLRLIAGKALSQAVSTAATLGITDALTSPATIDELAQRIDASPRLLDRLMAVLVSEGLYAIDDDGRFHVTPLGAELGEGRMKDFALFAGSENQWAPWAKLPDAIRTGRGPYEMTHGTDLYGWLAEHPDDAERYDRAIEAFTRAQAHALATAHDFEGVEHVIDIGGGRGTMLLELLERWPKLRGTLLDIDHVARAADERFVAAGMRERCRAIGGDFFEPLPKGGDVYLLGHILHNWDDDDAIRVLTRCREAMKPGACVLAVEGILLPGHDRSTSRLMDLEMMVLFGHGRERSKLELRRLFDAAGLTMAPFTAPLAGASRLLTATIT